jgi:hypothetical protein
MPLTIITPNAHAGGGFGSSKSRDYLIAFIQNLHILLTHPNPNCARPRGNEAAERKIVAAISTLLGSLQLLSFSLA